MTCTCPPGAHDSDAPGSRYWVSVQDAGRSAFVAGPYDTHGEAEADVDLVRRLGEERDPRAVFYAWGTARTDADVPVPAPQLNAARYEKKGGRECSATIATVQ